MFSYFPSHLRLYNYLFYVVFGMERTAKTTWYWKRKLQARKKRMREAKLAKSSAPTTGGVSSDPGPSTASEAAGESLASTSGPSEGTPTEDMRRSHRNRLTSRSACQSQHN